MNKKFKSASKRNKKGKKWGKREKRRGPYPL